MRDSIINSKYVVMHMISSGFFGGPEKQILYHLEYLNNTKYYKGIIASFRMNNGTNELILEARKAGIGTVDIPIKCAYDFYAIMHIIKAIKDNKVSLLCTHHYKATILGKIAASRTGIPIIAYSRGYTREDFKVALYEWIERIFLKKVDGIICVSHGQLKKLEELGVKNPNKWVVHNAIQVRGNKKGVSESRGKCKNDKIVVTTAGRMSPEKGHYYLIKAIGLIKDYCNNVVFNFCGDGVLRSKLIKMAEKMGVSGICSFPGFCKNMSNIYQKSDIFVLPSLSEGLPNVILEAFSFAIPVVATNVGGVPEIVEDRINGLLIPPKNPEALADAILTLINNEEERIKMGLAGKEKMKKEFNFERQLRKTVRIYERFLK